MGRMRRAESLARILRDTTGGEYRKSVVNPAVSGRLFARGARVVLTDVVDALHGDPAFLFGTLGRGTAGVRGAMLVVVQLPRPVPNMVLMSARGSVLRRAGIALDERQRLRLEGDFDNSFTLYCPVDYETDALYIFAPDLMSRLLDTVRGCDVEFVDNRLLVYIPRTAFPDPETVGELPALLAFLNAKVDRNSRRYADDRRRSVSVADPFRRDQLLAVGGTDAGFRVGRDGGRVRTRLTLAQKIGAAVAALVALACAGYWIVSVWSAFA